MGLTFNLGRVSPSVFTDSSLNVGIGAAPSGTYKLEVTGTAKVSSTLLLGGALSGTSATFTSTITSNNAIGVEKNGSGTFGGGGRFYLYNAATTDGFLMQLNASNNIDYWGVTSNTPTASPVITFTRAGAATFSSSVTAGGYITGQGTNPGGLGGSRYVLDWLSGSMRIFSYGANASTNGGFVFNSQRSDGTNSFDPMTITSAGNVGIGTSSPLSLLHIASADTDQGIRLTRANGTFGIRITRTGQIQGKLSDDTTFQTAISLTEGNASGSQYLALQPTAGNVLIGTTTDNGYKLQFVLDGNTGSAAYVLYSQYYGGIVAVNTTSSSYYAFKVRNGSNAATSTGTDIFTVRGDGLIFAPGIYNNTNSNAANVWVNSDGSLYRSTASSIRYKENINDWNGSGLDTILALKPKTFKYKKDYYNLADVDFLGLIAEEVAEVSPYLAEYENQDRTGKVENVRYATIVVPLIAAIQEQQIIITSLQDRLDKAGL